MIQVVGTSHKQAPITIRERIAASGGSVESLLERARAQLEARECILVSTCNRVELYYVGPSGEHWRTAAKRLMAEAGEQPIACQHTYHHMGEEAVAHLFEVASGLDSMVLGEHEILGQVKEALRAAMVSGHAGSVLKRLFLHAVRTGKRARRETAISSGIFSVGQCAARMAEEVLGSLQGKRLLVFGAGRIAKVTAKHMASFGAGPITVFSRTYERAQGLASLVRGRAVTGSEMLEALRTSDILVGCASAPHHVVGVPEIQAAIADREGQPLVVIDLGVPRNVDPSVAELPDVRLFNIDNLEAVMAKHVEEREAEIERVGAIIAEEVAEFCRCPSHTGAAALISELRAKAEEVRQECLKLAARRQWSEEETAAVDYLTDLLVRKLLHGPITALRQAAGECAGDTDMVEAVRKLFGLAGEEAGTTGGQVSGSDPEAEALAHSAINVIHPKGGSGAR